jgi:predicted metalloprotease with PDZ domain
VIIDEVYGEQAQGAGVHEGDEIVAIDGEQIGRNFERKIANLKPGAKVRITVFSQGTHKDVELTLSERSLTGYVLRESQQTTAPQLARRRAWLESEDETPKASK